LNLVKNKIAVFCDLSLEKYIQYKDRHKYNEVKKNKRFDFEHPALTANICELLTYKEILRVPKKMNLIFRNLHL
jgi:hypothetical protein